jgi:hypothetical protein
MDSKAQIEIMKQRLEALESSFHRNNFEGSQDFNKDSRFNTTIKVPVKATEPAVCQQGELYVNSASGKLYVCSAADTWVVAGTQS